MQQLLLISAGVSAYLAMYNGAVWAMRRSQRVSLWLALWSLDSLVYQFARLTQLQPASEAALHLADRLCVAFALPLIPLLYFAVRDLTGSQLFARAGRLIAAITVAAVAINAATDLFIGQGLDHYVNFSGATVLFSRVGPLYAPFLVPLSLVVLLLGLAMVSRSSELSRVEKRVWLSALVLYELLGSNDLLLFSGISRALFPGLPGQSLFEFGAVGLAIALTLFMALRAEATQELLQRLVEARTAELRQALQTAQAASVAKAAFLASVSHEVRTPLNGILGLTELLLDEQLPVSVRERLQLVRGSGATLKRLLDDVLDFSKLDVGKLQVARVEFELEPALGQTVRLYEGVALGKGLALQLESSGLPALVAGDEQRLRQVLGNLVSNAVKFTSQGSVRVVATAARRDDGSARLRVEVRDSGPGLSPEQQKQLFVPFSQLDVSLTHPSAGGTGLGLAIAKELAALLGGGVGVQSEPGAGSTFHVELPLEVVSWERRAATPAPGSARVRQRFAGQVLVAEDNAVNQLVVDGMLRAVGITARLVKNGREAVDAAGSSPFDLVLMDCQMPELDGLEATRQLRAQGFAAPIVAVTGYANADEKAACFEAGMVECLTKPVRREELAAVLARFLKPAA